MRLGRRSLTVCVCALWVSLKWQIPFQSQQRQMGAPGRRLPAGGCARAGLGCAGTALWGRSFPSAAARLVAEHGLQGWGVCACLPGLFVFSINRKLFICI